MWAEPAKHVASPGKCGFGKFEWLFVRYVYPNFRPYLDPHVDVGAASVAEEDTDLTSLYLRTIIYYSLRCAHTFQGRLY